MQILKRWPLFRRRDLMVPTWRGCLVILLVLALASVLIGRHLHSFLAMNAPIRGGALVVEGWLPDYALGIAEAEFKTNQYSKMYVVGGPLERGAALSEYKTYAERAAAVLLKLGLTTNQVQAVPAPQVRQDRTYTAAVSLHAWAQKNGVKFAKVHLISEGPHARRSRLLFEKAFGPEVTIGITAVPSIDYDAEHWWRYSAGVRGVIDELAAYVYARILFNPR